MDKLLHAFAEFWREHGDVLTGNMTYHEVAPQLVLIAFLQRIVNGGGFIDTSGVSRHAGPVFACPCTGLLVITTPFSSGNHQVENAISDSSWIAMAST